MFRVYGTEGGAVDNGPLDSIRAKMAADPSYNPFNDPQAIQTIETNLPSEIREFGHAIERLKVAFKDANSGPDAAVDLDSAFATVTNKKDLISSPTSQWFKDGMDGNTDQEPSEVELAELKSKIKDQYPHIPDSV